MITWRLWLETRLLPDINTEKLSIYVWVIKNQSSYHIFWVKINSIFESKLTVLTPKYFPHNVYFWEGNIKWNCFIWVERVCRFWLQQICFGSLHRKEQPILSYLDHICICESEIGQCMQSLQSSLNLANFRLIPKWFTYDQHQKNLIIHHKTCRHYLSYL